MKKPALLCASLLAACTPSLNWREVRPAEADGLVAMFPCRPDHVQRTVPLSGLDGGPVTLHVLSCQAGGIQWALSHADAGTPARRRQALAALNASLWQNLSAHDPSQARRRPLGAFQVPGATPHPDAQAWSLTGMRPVSTNRMVPVRVKAWHFSHGLRVFQATAWQPALQDDDPRVEGFAEGFNFPG